MRRFLFTAKLIVVVIAAGLIAGCAGGPRMIRAGQELKPGPDAGLVVFLMPNALMGHDFSLWDREKFIGFTEPLSSVSFLAKPGEHILLVRGENWEIAKGKIEAGKAYFFWVDARIGVRGLRVSMQVLDPNDKGISQWLSLCKPLELEDASKGEAFEKKNARQVTKAINNVESGRAKFISFGPSQGK